MFPRKKKKKNDKVTIETEWNGIIKMESTAKENEMIKDGDVSRFILTVEISFRNSSLSRVTRKIHRVQTWYRILLMYQILFYLLHDCRCSPSISSFEWPRVGKGNLSNSCYVKKVRQWKRKNPEIRSRNTFRTFRLEHDRKLWRSWTRRNSI